MVENLKNIIRLAPFEEAIGILHRIQEDSGYCVADIGPVRVFLPEEMGPKLDGLRGRKIGVLKTDRDYRFRVCDMR